MQWGLLSTQAAKVTTTPQTKATPLDEDEIYYGLSTRPPCFRDLGGPGVQYSRRVLLIFSTMQDPQSGYKGMIKDYGIDLSNIDIITVLPNCWVDIFQDSCKTTIATWTGEFKQANAKSITFVNGHDLENYLISQLRGER